MECVDVEVPERRYNRLILLMHPLIPELEVEKSPVSSVYRDAIESIAASSVRIVPGSATGYMFSEHVDAILTFSENRISEGAGQWRINRNRRCGRFTEGLLMGGRQDDAGPSDSIRLNIRSRTNSSRRGLQLRKVKKDCGSPSERAVSGEFAAICGFFRVFLRYSRTRLLKWLFWRRKK